MVIPLQSHTALIEPKRENLSVRSTRREKNWQKTSERGHKPEPCSDLGQEGCTNLAMVRSAEASPRYTAASDKY